jgi:hypothetical protein
VSTLACARVAARDRGLLQSGSAAVAALACAADLDVASSFRRPIEAALTAPLVPMLELLEPGEDLIEPAVPEDVRVRRRRAIAENASGHKTSVGPLRGASNRRIHLRTRYKAPWWSRQNGVQHGKRNKF